QSNETSYNIGGQLVPGAAVTTLVDENISWEISESFDLGFELSLFKNSLNIEGGYFNKTTKDILVRLPISQILGGVSPPVENIGKMKNSGRSEEHTSELQSRFELVCRLLLEKKNRTYNLDSAKYTAPYYTTS